MIINPSFLYLYITFFMSNTEAGNKQPRDFPKTFSMAPFMKLHYSSCSLSWTLLLRFMLLLVVCCNTKALMKLPPNVSIPALIVFGDSIMDTGNNINLPTWAKCNYPPYGRDFEGGKATGRCCNGKIPSDIIVDELGIKKLLPAYLDPNLQPQELATGVCFASGAAGYDPLTSKLASAISLPAQLDLFNEYIGKLKGLVGEDRTKFILANSIVLVVGGSDDIANTYYGASLRQLHYDVPAYTDLMVRSASNFTQEIHQLGARRIGVFSAPPIGCVPSQRTVAGGSQRNCAEKHNNVARLFNSKLSKELDSLNQNLPDSTILYVDIYNPLLDIIVNYQNYGYKVADRGCCGTGLIEASETCNRFVPTCSNVSDYIFWDSFHPTEGAYRKLIAPILQKFVDQYVRGN